MTTLELPGRITKNGKLKVDLPKGLPAGNVTVRIDVPAESASDWEHQPWTDDEIKELMTPKPRTGAEIAAWLEANPPTNPNWGGITSDDDVAGYVRQMRSQTHPDWGEAE